MKRPHPHHGRAVFFWLMAIVLSATATAHGSRLAIATAAEQRGNTAGVFHGRQLRLMGATDFDKPQSTAPSPGPTSISLLPPVAAPPLMAPAETLPPSIDFLATSPTAAQQAGVAAGGAVVAPSAAWAVTGAGKPPANATAPDVAPIPNWGNNPFAPPVPGNPDGLISPTPLFNTILITGVGIAAVVVCSIGCMASWRFVHRNQLPRASSAGRQRGEVGREETDQDKGDEQVVPMRRAVIVRNPGDDVIIGVEVTPSVGHPVDVPKHQENSKDPQASSPPLEHSDSAFLEGRLSEISLR